MQNPLAPVLGEPINRHDRQVLGSWRLVYILRARQTPVGFELTVTGSAVREWSASLPLAVPTLIRYFEEFALAQGMECPAMGLNRLRRLPLRMRTCVQVPLLSWLPWACSSLLPRPPCQN